MLSYSPILYITSGLNFCVGHVFPFPIPTTPEESRMHQRTVLIDTALNFLPTSESRSSTVEDVWNDVLDKLMVYLGHLRVRACCCRSRRCGRCRCCGRCVVVYLQREDPHLFDSILQFLLRLHQLSLQLSHLRFHRGQEPCSATMQHVFLCGTIS